MAKSSAWRSIAVVVDPLQKGHPGLKKAASLARASRARLTLLSTFVLPQPMVDVGRISAKEIVRAAIRDRRQKLEKLAAGLRRRGLQVQCVVEWDYPQHEALVRYVLKARPDVLVAESGRHGRIARWILSNTDWELIRSCPCPLWLVRSDSLPKKPTLLVAVDPGHADARRSRLDSRLLGAAQELAGRVGGAMAIVHADHADDSQLDAVERLAKRYGVPPARRYVIPGKTTQVLPEVAEMTSADVLVLGAVSRSRLHQPFIGTTAERVIDRVECDLFVVKPVGYKSPVSRRRPRMPE
ncbi:MAG: universal stress protein [Gammaproteobacteria bacterium]|nr:universal stress protein [Gammaproteobacteria bacterium]